MKTMLLQGDIGGTYLLMPVSRRVRRRLEKETGEDSVLFQTDWDFPGLARDLGWNGKVGRERCQHRGTDGTVTCPDCGRSASEFIAAAANWLDAHCGCVFVGKGEDYFGV